MTSCLPLISMSLGMVGSLKCFHEFDERPAILVVVVVPHGAVEMPGVVIARDAGIELEWNDARLVGESDLVTVELAAANPELRFAPADRQQQLIERAHRAVVQIRTRSPDAVQWPGLVIAIQYRLVE